jgi:hypothetical protein
MSAHVLPPLAVNSKSERNVNSLPPLGFEPAIFGTLAHLGALGQVPPQCLTGLKESYPYPHTVLYTICFVVSRSHRLGIEGTRPTQRGFGRRRYSLPAKITKYAISSTLAYVCQRCECLARSSVFSLAKSENQLAKGSVRGENNLARLASGFVILFANPIFYSHLASSRVVIRTPACIVSALNVCCTLGDYLEYFADKSPTSILRKRKDTRFLPTTHGNISVLWRTSKRLAFSILDF